MEDRSFVDFNQIYNEAMSPKIKKKVCKENLKIIFDKLPDDCGFVEGTDSLEVGDYIKIRYSNRFRWAKVMSINKGTVNCSYLNFSCYSSVKKKRIVGALKPKKERKPDAFNERESTTNTR